MKSQISMFRPQFSVLSFVASVAISECIGNFNILKSFLFQQKILPIFRPTGVSKIKHGERIRDF